MIAFPTLSTRINNAMRQCGITTHEQFMQMSFNDFARLPGIGNKSLKEIDDYRRSHGASRYPKKDKFSWQEFEDIISQWKHDDRWYRQWCRQSSHS